MLNNYVARIVGQQAYTRIKPQLDHASSLRQYMGAVALPATTEARMACQLLTEPQPTPHHFLSMLVLAMQVHSDHDQSANDYRDLCDNYFRHLVWLLHLPQWDDAHIPPKFNVPTVAT
jgi:hypothetical protein